MRADELNDSPRLLRKLERTGRPEMQVSEGNEYFHPFIIADLTNEGILGMDFPQSMEGS